MPDDDVAEDSAQGNPLFFLREGFPRDALSVDEAQFSRRVDISDFPEAAFRDEQEWMPRDVAGFAVEKHEAPPEERQRPSFIIPHHEDKVGIWDAGLRRVPPVIYGGNIGITSITADDPPQRIPVIFLRELSRLVEVRKPPYRRFAAFDHASSASRCIPSTSSRTGTGFFFLMRSSRSPR